MYVLGAGEEQKEGEKREGNGVGWEWGRCSPGQASEGLPVCEKNVYVCICARSLTTGEGQGVPKQAPPHTNSGEFARLAELMNRSLCAKGACIVCTCMCFSRDKGKRRKVRSEGE